MSVTIGDFSRMTHLSVKTLRHYHQVGLLEPAEVNRGTGYRYYDTDQVPTAQVIRRFRDLGMPVESVKAVLEAPDVASRNSLIASHLDRLESQLDQTQAAVISLRNLLEQPESPIEIEHRSVPSMLAVGIRETVTVADLGAWWSGALGEIDAHLSSSGIERLGPRGGLYDTDLFVHERGEAVVFVPVVEAPPQAERVESLVIPAAELAIATHAGAHGDIDRTYGVLGTYVTEHALSVEGRVREAYLVSEFETPKTSLWRTEIGWPIFQTLIH
jgi:DNA-binding transcriptional MerR regulator/effector-binding domain-containing protein